jgi:hypothetical protein
MKLSALCCVTAFTFSTFSFAEVFHCENLDGSKSFQDQPCKETTIKTEQKAEVSNSMPEHDSNVKNNSVIMTHAQLIGTWTDLIGKDTIPFRNIWKFTSNIFYGQKATGLTERNKYTFKDNKITINIDNDIILSKGTVITLEIVAFDGETITFSDDSHTKHLYKLR